MIEAELADFTSDRQFNWSQESVQILKLYYWLDSKQKLSSISYRFFYRQMYSSISDGLEDITHFKNRFKSTLQFIFILFGKCKILCNLLMPWPNNHANTNSLNPEIILNSLHFIALKSHSLRLLIKHALNIQKTGSSSRHVQTEACW